MLNNQQLADLSTLIKQIGQDEIQPASATIARQYKSDGSLVTEVDLRVNSQIQQYLEKHFPDTTFLSEEMTEAEQLAALASGAPCWCLDPLDGTSNFSAGVPFYAISLALLQNNESVLGLIYDPFRDELFSAIKDQGATLNGVSMKLEDKEMTLGESVALLDFKRLPVEFRQQLVAKPPYGSQRNFGACALEWCWMAAGRGDLYLHGGQKLWDLAAGILIFSEAGGLSSDFNKHPVFDGTLNPRPVIASPYRRLFQDWQEFVSLRINPGPS